MIELHLAYPPSANRLWRRGLNSTYLSPEYERWKREAAWQIKSQTRQKVTGPYAISIQVKRPDKRRRDLDNLLKPISDALVASGVIDDDSYCELLSARWVTTGDGVRVLLGPAGVEE